MICGAYGYGNAGDDAILKSIIRSVQELDDAMPITVLAKNTQSIKKRYRVGSIYTFNLPKMVAAMGKSVLYINGGGTPDPKRHQLAQPLVLPVHPCGWPSCWGTKVDMYGCGIGPVTGKKNIRLVKRVLDRSVDTITLRETDSMKELEALGCGGRRSSSAQTRPWCCPPPPIGCGRLSQPPRPGERRSHHLLYAAHLVRL